MTYKKLASFVQKTQWTYRRARASPPSEPALPPSAVPRNTRPHARGPIERYNDAIDRSTRMPRLVRCSLIQAHADASPDLPLPEIKRVMIDKHLGYIRQAAEAGARIVCLQELFN